MLYVTTRDNRDAYTAYRALREDLAPDGGRFIPFRLPLFSANEIAQMRVKSFGEVVAELMNIFFSCQLTGWDVDFCVGRNAVRLITMNQRVILAELWHNPSANFGYFIDCLYRKIANCSEPSAPTDWVRIAVQISVIFGLYAEMLKSESMTGDQSIDISVSCEDLSALMAVWYARSMGLPIGMIICTCNSTSPMWDLIHRNTFNTSASNVTTLLGIERLIEALFGISEAQRYCEVCSQSKIFEIAEEHSDMLRNAFFCAVAGEKRAETIINSVFRSNSYIIDPITALCYGGVQDYRSRTGSNKITLLIADRTPLDYSVQVSSATGIPEANLIDYVKIS